MILEQLSPKDELLLVLNGATLAVQRWALTLTHPNLNILNLPSQSRCSARNVAFQLARGNIIHFLDDDAYPTRGLYAKLEKEFEWDPDLKILGGPNLTPPGSSKLAKIFGQALASPFAAPWVWRRYCDRPSVLAQSDERHFILCNLAIRKDAFPQGPQFDSRLQSNEENVFLSKSRNAGAKVRFDPSLAVFHDRRRSWAEFGGQLRSYGYGRFQQVLWHSDGVADSVWWLALTTVLTLFLAACFGTSGWLALALLYVMSSIWGAFWARARGWDLVLAPVLAGFIHVQYFLGFIKGLLVHLRLGVKAWFRALEARWSPPAERWHFQSVQPPIVETR